LAGLAIENEVGAVVHDPRAAGFGGASEAADGERVDRERGRGPILCSVHVIERRAIDDHRGRGLGDRPAHRVRIGDVERGPRQRDRRPIREGVHDRRTKPAGGPDDENGTAHRSLQ
jgi:hypothetical protein